MKRQQMKKKRVEGSPRPLHIRAYYWLSLSILIANVKKQKQAEKIEAKLSTSKEGIGGRKIRGRGQSEPSTFINLVLHICWNGCIRI
jgi:hypothetical protein